MAEQNYTYAVARIRSRELSLLNASFMEQLLGASDEETAVRMLQERGWGSQSMSVEEMLEQEHDRTWDLISELVKDVSVFHVFLYENDYHNLKAAIKESCTAGKHPGIYKDQGTFPAELMEKAVTDREFSLLPEKMQDVAKEATDILLKTRDGQLCDCIVDRAALQAIYQAGKDSGDSLLALYGELTVVAADIKSTIRAVMTGKGRSFLEYSLAPCDTLDISRLMDAAQEGMEAIYSYLETTRYADAVESMKKSLAVFECWCDNLMIRNIRSQLSNPFGLGPLAAYILARENEIKTVRIILSGKHNDFSEEYIRGRVRETYV